MNDDVMHLEAEATNDKIMYTPLQHNLTFHLPDYMMILQDRNWKPPSDLVVYKFIIPRVLGLTLTIVTNINNLKNIFCYSGNHSSEDYSSANSQTVMFF
jgi:hypothetical protein